MKTVLGQRLQGGDIDGAFELLAPHLGVGGTTELNMRTTWRQWLRHLGEQGVDPLALPEDPGPLIRGAFGHLKDTTVAIYVSRLQVMYKGLRRAGVLPGHYDPLGLVNVVPRHPGRRAHFSAEEAARLVAHARGLRRLALLMGARHAFRATEVGVRWGAFNPLTARWERSYQSTPLDDDVVQAAMGVLGDAGGVFADGEPVFPGWSAETLRLELFAACKAANVTPQPWTSLSNLAVLASEGQSDHHRVARLNYADASMLRRQRPRRASLRGG